MVVTNDDSLAERIRLLRSHGMTTLTWDRHRGHASSYDVVAHGFNYRLDELRAALGLVQLGRLDEQNAARAQIVSRYRRELDGFGGLRVAFASGDPDASSAPASSPVASPGRDRPAAGLPARGLPLESRRARDPDERPLPADPPLLLLPPLPGASPAARDRAGRGPPRHPPALSAHGRRGRRRRDHRGARSDLVGGGPMELNDAARRIGRRWHLLVLFVGLGAVAGILLARGPETYSASTRLVLEAQYPKSRSESAAIADTAQAIATSPSMVAKALATVGVTRRDAAAIAKDEVSVSPLGTSGVVKLTVRDEEPAGRCRDRQRARGGSDRDGTDRLQRTGSEDPRRVRPSDRRSRRGKSRARTRRVAAPSWRSAPPSRPSASTCSRRRPADRSRRSSVAPPHRHRRTPRPSRRTPRLGALLGLILGIGVVGLVETIRPTIVGGRRARARARRPAARHRRIPTRRAGRSGDARPHRTEARTRRRHERRGGRGPPECRPEREPGSLG